MEEIILSLTNKILTVFKKKINEKEIKQIIDLLPKTEIHVHIEALVSVKTLVLLNNKYKIDTSIQTSEDLIKKYNIAKFKNLNEMISFFFHIQNHFKNETDLKYLMHDAKDYMLRNNIYYMEFYFAPSLFIKNGNDIYCMLKIIETEIDKLEAKYFLKMKMILDVSRSFGVKNAEQNLNYLLTYLKQPDCGKHIIGIGLGGQEKNNSATFYKAVFEKATQYGLNLVAHAGEETGPESIWKALKDLNAMRIGHGTSAIFDDKLMEYLKERQIPLEICLTSNIKTGKYVKKIKDHPIKKFYQFGLMVTINSDDPILFNVELNDEFYNLYHDLEFTLSEILDILKKNLFATFLSEQEKKEIWEQKLESIYNDILKKF